jgi:hypothetical protein
MSFSADRAVLDCGAQKHSCHLNAGAVS